MSQRHESALQRGRDENSSPQRADVPDPISVFATSPQSKDVAPDSYLRAVGEVARWSEAAGCEGILVYTDNGLVDPWLVSQAIVQSTERLCPLVAVQPVYMHPYAVAKMVASIAYLHGRRVYLNMLAGGFKNDLLALGDQTPHDERYARTSEYASIVKHLLSGAGPLDLEGRYFTVRGLRMTPPVPAELAPGWMISGSSPAGLAAAAAIGAVAIKYPKPTAEETPSAETPSGVRVGLVARATREEAWRVAHERFPESRKGKIVHAMAMKTSDSHWHEQLSAPSAGDEGATPYWLGPFQHYQTFCPYLVGSYEEVAEEVRAYVRLGHTTFVLDIPPSEEELEHTGVVFELARRSRA